jgi:hypothetical protein
MVRPYTFEKVAMSPGDYGHVDIAKEGGSRGQLKRGGLPAWRLGEVLKSHRRTNSLL